MICVVCVSWGFAQEDAADDSGTSKYEVTGIPLYEGPMYRTLDSEPADITKGEQWHSFHHRPVEEVGYSPLTLDDFRFPVVSRVGEEFRLERLKYPDHDMLVWFDKPNQLQVTAFFFTRDMVRDHIQQIIDTYYVCDPDTVQQIIDYYAEVTPQVGEAISWVWFKIDRKGHYNTDTYGNRYFENYLANFKDKIYLEIGLPKAQDIVDDNVHDFLYQYRHRGPHHCSAEFQDTGSCDKCGSCGDCGSMGCVEKDCNKCGGTVNCNTCPEAYTEPHDKPLKCCDYTYGGFNLNLNEHYLYAPRKVVIEDMTFDPLAQAYRWKLAWRFTDCEIDWLRQMCAYGQFVEMRMVMTDPHWNMVQEVPKTVKRDVLAAMDPQTWGNVWAAGNLPYDMEFCDCPLPTCDGNCTVAYPVGWDYMEPVVPAPPTVTPPPPPPTDTFPVPEEEEDEPEVVNVPGKG